MSGVHSGSVVSASVTIALQYFWHWSVLQDNGDHTVGPLEDGQHAPCLRAFSEGTERRPSCLQCHSSGVLEAGGQVQELTVRMLASEE